MKQTHLSTKGLSMSQAQSISNLCNQRAREIDAILSNLNNASKTVSVDGKEYITTAGKPIPADVVKLISTKATLHACQAFLRENMVAKENMLLVAKSENSDLSSIEYPKSPDFVEATYLDQVKEDFGWSKLTPTELAEYWEAQAFAAHIGKFIHEKSPLDRLRNELPTLPEVEWTIIKDGEKSPVSIVKHHTSEQLMVIHEELAGLHRNYEQKVNYYEAKVKNLTTEENARIAKLNADARNEANAVNAKLSAEYETKLNEFNAAVLAAKAEFEKARQAKIKEVAALRIAVDPRFQAVVDEFLSKMPKEG